MKKSNNSNKVEKLLFSMFTESTGSHFLDSGGIYGRHWERNQKLTIKDALNIPTVEHSIHEYKDGQVELNITVNTFKYLINSSLELDSICDKFNRMQKNCNDWDFENLYGVCKKAGEYLESLDSDIKDSWNTYNDSIQYLSQVLQGAYIEINGENYVCLQIHQGCDVRGGYTDAKLFKLNSWAEYLPLIDIYGSVDGVQVDNMYNGYSLTNESGQSVDIKKDSIIELDLMIS